MRRDTQENAVCGRRERKRDDGSVLSREAYESFLSLFLLAREGVLLPARGRIHTYDVWCSPSAWEPFSCVFT